MSDTLTPVLCPLLHLCVVFVVMAVCCTTVVPLWPHHHKPSLLKEQVKQNGTVKHSGTLIVGHSDTVLTTTDGFDPSNVNSITFKTLDPSDHHRLSFHVEDCANSSIEEKPLSILNGSVRDNSVPHCLGIDDRYMLAGSSVTYNITLLPYQYECLGTLYIFKDLISYKECTGHDVTTLSVVAVPMCGVAVFSYTLNVNDTGYYFAGIYIPAFVWGNFPYTLEGSILYYKLRTPEVCHIDPKYNSSCTVPLTASGHQDGNLCVLMRRESVKPSEDNYTTVFYNYTSKN